jgi:plasmid stabilization system protein ParE
MMTCRLTRRARQDVLNIWRRIAQDNEPAADRFIDLLTHHFPTAHTRTCVSRRIT